MPKPLEWQRQRAGAAGMRVARENEVVRYQKRQQARSMKSWLS
jgi:hypothetical protein